MCGHARPGPKEAKLARPPRLTLNREALQGIVLIFVGVLALGGWFALKQIVNTGSSAIAQDTGSTAPIAVAADSTEDQLAARRDAVLAVQHTRIESYDFSIVEEIEIQRVFLEAGGYGNVGRLYGEGFFDHSTGWWADPVGSDWRVQFTGIFASNRSQQVFREITAEWIYHPNSGSVEPTNEWAVYFSGGPPPAILGS